MTAKRFLVLLAGIVSLAGCAADPPPAPRHHCITIPNGLVECTQLEPTGPAAPPRR